MKVIALDQIKSTLSGLDLITDIEAGFVAYSDGQAVVPPVGELLLDRGEVHIKYGYIEGDEYYVIKIASGFYDNPKIGLPSSNGLMLMYRQETGELVSILLDEGHLTNTRTAVAGAIAAKHLGPEQVERIGIVGTGVQARLQLQYLADVTPCRRVLVWGRGDEQLDRFRREIGSADFVIETTRNADDILPACNLIVTTTPATSPLLHASGLRPGTHITAVGSDTPHKQELDSAILRRADLVVVDSKAQCLERGEIYRATQSVSINADDIIELGNVISGKSQGRASDTEITVADLTGVAVQDIKIATAVYEAVTSD
jgi:ornithine cyclodeaminase